MASDGWNSPQKVDARDVDAHAAELSKPRYMVGFRYYEQTSTVVDGETLNGPRKYDPGVYYFGERIAVADIDSLQKIPDWQRDNIKFNLQQGKQTSAILLRNGGVRECTDADTALAAFSEGIRAALAGPQPQPGQLTVRQIRRTCGVEGSPLKDALRPAVQEGLARMGDRPFTEADVREKLESVRGTLTWAGWDLSCRFDRESYAQVQRDVAGLEALLSFMGAHAADVKRLDPDRATPRA